MKSTFNWVYAAIVIAVILVVFVLIFIAFNDQFLKSAITFINQALTFP